jgi:hypothetical protein
MITRPGRSNPNPEDRRHVPSLSFTRPRLALGWPIPCFSHTVHPGCATHPFDRTRRLLDLHGTTPLNLAQTGSSVGMWPAPFVKRPVFCSKRTPHRPTPSFSPAHGSPMLITSTSTSLSPASWPCTFLFHVTSSHIHTCCATHVSTLFIHLLLPLTMSRSLLPGRWTCLDVGLTGTVSILSGEEVYCTMPALDGDPSHLDDDVTTHMRHCFLSSRSSFFRFQSSGSFPSGLPDHLPSTIIYHHRDIIVGRQSTLITTMAQSGGSYQSGEDMWNKGVTKDKGK